MPEKPETQPQEAQQEAPPQDELSEEQMDEVAGGIIVINGDELRRGSNTGGTASPGSDRGIIINGG